jgi:hypothetical protein
MMTVARDSTNRPLRSSERSGHRRFAFVILDQIGKTRMSPKTAKSVAAILERELDSMIREWKRQVSLVPCLTNILLSDADRTGHLPVLFDEVLLRLQSNRDTEPPVSIAAAAHGRLRFAQGYSLAMLVEESRILEVTTFGTLQRHQGELNRNQVLLDVVVIADEADRQLEETVNGFMAARAAA